MSRLDSVIRRLQAQRSCINFAAAEINDKDGIILELGLGNGRTYDHMRGILPNHKIYVFERQVNAHLDCIPDDEYLFLGDIEDTIAKAVKKLGKSVIMLHTDIGTGDPIRNRKLAKWLSNSLPPLLQSGAIIISDRELSIIGSITIDTPEDVPKDRYFMYKME